MQCATIACVNKQNISILVKHTHQKKEKKKEKKSRKSDSILDPPLHTHIKTSRQKGKITQRTQGTFNVGT